jgi:hypothetical protein
MLELKYFILKPKSKISRDPYAKASRAAMLVYADLVDIYDSKLAIDLRDWVRKEEELDASRE